ncbi:Methyltransferase domain-containing protein [Paenibacillus sp. UNCCL117]|uniref:class I SAM-dependent methyltransferase n=1 Tax=unclassified Paenibacillus TaxID=185978 RepID=UPI00088E30D6|nr:MULTISPECIES: class I SAM-dependent methyltransferase [unclassified Paenibacillus]SDD26398.1 Methyltransferase domain-containing protein [Paenibacillus sp. cl123]SFW41099.1 Methyltransferase domain-containing protein [Paenibacillus sp. UNCCL117]
MSEWYTKSFGDDYLVVYKHRDMQGAYEEVRSMMEWLELPEGSEVLDLCCGMGRHSMALTGFGFRVTGVDLSEVLLTEARKLDEGGEVVWVRGDMREVPLEGPYDAVVNLFTSFGYFEEDADHERVLGEIRRLLSSEGRFIIDFLNPEHVRTHLVPHSVRTEDGLRIEENRRIERGYVCKTIILQDSDCADKRVYEEKVKLIGLEEFRVMLDKAGLIVDAVYGGYDASPYSAADSKRMIFVGRKGEAGE